MSPLADIPAPLIDAPDENRFAAWLGQYHLPEYLKRDITREWEAATGVHLSASKFDEITKGTKQSRASEKP